MLVDIGGQDFDIQLASVRQERQQRQGDRVGLFAAGAASRPDAHPSTLAGLLDQGWQRHCLENFEVVWLAEETCDIGRQRREEFQPLCLALWGVEEVAILAKACHAGRAKPLGHA